MQDTENKEKNTTKPRTAADRRPAWIVAAVALTAWLTSPASAEDPAAYETPPEIPVIPVAPTTEPESATALVDQPTVLPAIVVVATRTPRAADDVAASVAVIDDRAIEYLQASSLGDVFRNLAGVAIEGGPRANAEFVNVRGLSGPRVLMIVDGARQNFLGGHRSSLLLEPELLKQVELLRGPASALWGSDALGGVMVFTTRDASDFLRDGERFAARLRTGFESAADERLGSGIGAARLGDFDFVGSFSQRQSDDLTLAGGEVEPHTALDTQGSLAKLSWFPGDGPHRMTLIHQGFRQSGQSPSNPATAIGNTNPLIDRTNDDVYSILRYAFASGDSAWLRAAQFNLYRDKLHLREDRVAAPRADRTHFQTDGASGHISVPGNWGIGGESLFTLGAEYFRDSAHATRNGEPRPQYPDSRRSVAGLFVQSELALGPFSVVPGARYDRYEAISNTSAARAISDSAVSPKLGLVYRVTEGLSVRGGYNSAFRAPGLVEIYAAGQHFLGNNFVPNPDLRPEKARNLELGFAWNLAGFGAGQQALLSGSVYRNKVRDFIELYVEATSELAAPQCLPPQPAVGCVNRNEDGSANPATPPIYVGGTTGSRNLAGATLSGGELETAYALGPAKLGVSYSQVRGSSDADGAPLVSMPADRVRSTLDLNLFTGIRSTLGFTHSFAQDRVPVLEDGTPVVPPTPAHATWDWSASWEPAGAPAILGLREPRLVFGVDNLTDTDYRDHLNVLRSPGRNARASFSASF